MRKIHFRKLSRNHFKWFFLVVFIVVVVVLVLTWQARIRQEVPVKEAVRLYTSLLSQALANFDPEILQSVATPNQLSRVRTYFIYLKGNNKTIMGRVVKLNFKNIKIRDEVAQVETEEEWDYIEVDLRTQQSLGKGNRKVYNVSYSLIFDAGDWKVDNLEIKKEREVTR
jgi:uncharacterized membrane protein